MSLPTLLPILTTILFGVIAFLYALKEDSLKKRLASEEKKEKIRNFQVSVLREIQEKGYGFNIEKVLEIITANLTNLFPYSAVSTLLMNQRGLRFVMKKEHAISTAFAEDVKKSMLASLAALINGDLPPITEQSFYGREFDEMSIKRPESYFHIPLIMNERVVGVLNITSSTPNQYQEDEITLLYQLVNQASHPIAHLEEVLAKEKGTLLAMIASVGDGIVMVDTNKEVTIINTTARKLLNQTKPKISYADLISALPNTQNFVQKIADAIEKKVSCEIPSVTLGERECKMVISPVVYHLQDTEKVIGACMTITDQTAERSVLHMKEDFTNVIVHELRSPLTAIKAGTDLLLAQKDQLSAHEQNKLLDLINSQSVRLLDEVSLILDAAKLEAGLFTLHRSEVNVVQLVNETVDMFAAAAKNKFISLTVLADSSLPSIIADKRALGQVLNNLISNSLKFTPVGGQIKIVAEKDNGKLRISVSDNGIGIDKAMQDKLFKKFSQIMSPNANVGTGLGLYIVKGIIEAHGGQVSLLSDHLHGTTITFSIPMVASQSVQQMTPAPRIAGAKPTVSYQPKPLLN